MTAHNSSATLWIKLSTFAKIGFFAALLFTLVMATLPNPPALPAAPSDKVQHILAFFVLTIVHCVAYPRVSFVLRIVVMAMLGAGIEIVQAYPPLHRDGNLADFIADVAAVLVASALMAVLTPASRNTVTP